MHLSLKTAMKNGQLQADYARLEVRRADMQAKLVALQSKFEASQNALALRKEKEITPDMLAAKVGLSHHCGYTK